MAPFEIMVIMLVTLYAYYESKSMGLHAPIPPPGPTRANYYGHTILTILKQQLGHHVPLEVQSGWIEFRAGQEQRRIFCERGILRLQVGGGDPLDLHPLGERGSVHFRLVRADLLQIDVVCEPEPLHPYRASLRVPVAAA
jgi:hypothetical protein